MDKRTDVWVGEKGRLVWMDGWQIGEQTFHTLLLPEVGHQADRQQL